MPKRPLLLAALALFPATAAAQAAPRSSPSDAPLQAVVVVTDGWDATDAVLRRYERASADAPWRPVGDSIRAVVGRTGLAWGLGLAPVPSAGGGPVKREGDGKSPAGVFRLGPAFGYAPADSVRGLHVAYVPTDASVECVDDSKSRHYNRLVDRDVVPEPDWTSHEEMRRDDEIYRLGLYVHHNADSPVPEGGSCIFLHIWRAPGVPTIGCTAMDAGDLAGVVRWLDAFASPVLVQAPRAQIASLTGPLRLP